MARSVDSDGRTSYKRPIDVMPNGAVVLEERVTDYGWVVLAFLPDSAQKYATWRRICFIDTDGQERDFCETGHYTNDLNEALDDYEARA
jgi:hypothetical protein